MKRYTAIIIALSLMLISLLSVPVWAKTHKLKKWTPEVARKLLQKNWENLNLQEERPLVIYLLRFVELDNKVTGAFESISKLENKNSENSGWKINVNDDNLKIIHDYSRSFSMELLGKHEENNSKNYFDSWLMTTGTEPISISLQEKLYSTEEYEEERNQFYINITLQPEQVDQENKEIHTELNFEYLNLLGAISETQTTGWVKQTADKPIALVSYQIYKNNEKIDKYFALYLMGTIIPADKLPEQQVLSSGDVSGLNRLFPDYLNDEEISREFMIGYDKDGVLLNYNQSRGNNLVYAGFNNDSENSRYNAGLDYPIFTDKELMFSGRVDNESSMIEETDPFLRLGLSDKVKLGNMLKMKVSYLPFNYNIAVGKFKSISWKGVTLKLERPKWNIWYQGTDIDGMHINGVGLTYKFTSSVGFQLMASKKDGNEKKYGFGIVLR